MDENPYNLPGLLDADVSPSFWRDLIDRLQISGMVEQQSHRGSKSVYGGGRIGYSFPIDDAVLSLGLLGGGYKASGNAPTGRYKASDFGVNGVDATYNNGLHTFGASYQKQPSIGDIINLFYQRQF